MNLLTVVWAALLALGVAQNPTNGSIAGTLKTSDGAPIAGVRVAAMAVQDAFALPNSASVLVSLAETDAAGRYRLENIPPGPYYITAGSVGTPTYYPGSMDPGPSSIVTISAGSALTGYDFSPISFLGGAVRGRVAIPSATFPPPREMSLFGQQFTSSSSPQNVSTPIKEDGSFEFRRVPPGAYLLSTRPGMPIVTGNSEIIVRDRDIEGIQLVVAKQVYVPVRFEMEPGSSLPAKVLTVSVRSASSLPSASSTGSVLGFRLFEGEYQVSLSGLPMGYIVKSVTYGNSDIGNRSMKVDASTQEDLIFHLGVLPLSEIRGVKVSGRVANAAREWTLMSTRTIRLGSIIPNGPTIETRVNPDNSFEFAKVPKGIYKLSIADLVGGASLFPEITVADNDFENATINLRNIPFPEYPGGSYASVFDSRNQQTIHGVVTQSLTQICCSAPILFFRLDVKDDAGNVAPWAVMLTTRTPIEELIKFLGLTVGATVTVTGIGTRDGTLRLSVDSLGQTPASINGISVPNLSSP